MAHGDHLKYSGKPKAGKKTFLRLISYVACDRRLLIVIGVLIVISIAANLTGSYMLRPIINDYILPGDFQGLVRILLFLAAISALSMPHLQPYLEVGYGIGTHVFDVGVFVSSENWKFSGIGCKFTFELFNR